MRKDAARLRVGMVVSVSEVRVRTGFDTDLKRPEGRDSYKRNSQ